MGFLRHGSPSDEFGGGDRTPCDGDGDDGEEQGQFSGAGETGIFEVQSPRFGVAEQALDAPPLAV